jgi:hypothetical protein
VLAVWFPPHVSLFRNAGGGRFIRHAVLGDVGAGPVTPTAADIDGDGDLDIVLGSSISAAVSVLVNDGGGAFGRRLAFNEDPDVVDGPPYGFDVLDLDGDGRREIVYIDAGWGEVEILWDDGGGIRSLQRLGRDDADFYRIGDFDRDGLPDIFVFRGVDSGDPCGNFIYRNSGQRTFTRAPAGALECVRHFWDAGDADGDGHDDLLVHEGGYSLSFRLADGAGGLIEGPQFALGPGVVSLEDIGGDGSRALVQFSTRRGIAVFPVSLGLPASMDEDGDGVPDECERVPFHRGDPSGDGRTNVTDVIFLLEGFFRRGPPPGCREAADAENDGRVGLHDAVTLLRYLFLAGAPPAPPGPPPGPCGLDPDLRGSGGDLGCERYDPCAGR